MRTRVDFVKTAEDDSFLWLKLKRVVQDCPEVYFCVCYMPSKKLYKNSDLKTPYACLQDDILQFQGSGAEVLICGDMNARTAERDDFIKLSELPECLEVPDEADDLPPDIPPRRNCDKGWVPSENWGPELLDLCKDTSLLILNGRTPGDEAGKYTFGIASSSGHSAIDYFIASAQCMSAAVSLQVNEDAEVYCTDHHSVVLHMLCETLAGYEHNSSHFSTVERIRYDDQNADAYEEYLTAVLHSQWLPLLQQSADVDRLSKALADLALEAARETTPQARKRRGTAAYVSKPWYDEACRNAYKSMKHVLQCQDSTAEHQQPAQKQYKSVIKAHRAPQETCDFRCIFIQV